MGSLAFPKWSIGLPPAESQLCAEKLLNLLLKWQGFCALEMYLIKEDYLDNYIFCQLGFCRPWAALDSSKQYALEFNVTSFWTLSLFPLPLVCIPNILKASQWWKCFLLYCLFSFWCYTSTLLHSVTGLETSAILIDTESSNLASFKFFFFYTCGRLYFLKLVCHTASKSGKILYCSFAVWLTCMKILEL